MAYFASIIGDLMGVVNGLLDFYNLVIFASVILSWVSADPYNPIVRFIRTITEPAFHFFRRFLPKALLRTGIDFAPMAVLLGILLIQIVLIKPIILWSHRSVLGL